jgi:RHS repeat-associated protein
MKQILTITFCSFFLVVMSQPVVFAQIIQQKINSYDSFGNPLEVEDAKGVKVSYDWSKDGTNPIGIFRNAGKDQVYAHSFALDSLDGWSFTDVGGDGDTQVTISEGKLKLKNFASATNGEVDRIYYDHGSELTEDVVWEFDVRIANSNNWDLTIAAGGNSWDRGLGSTERAVWSSINNEAWKYYDATSGWVTIKSGLQINQVYQFKIVMRPGVEKVDYYVNGEKLIDNVDFRFTSSGIQNFAFGNYGYGSTTTEWFIDNVRIYPEGAQAQSQEVDEVLGTTLAVKDPAGFTSRYEYDDFARLTKAYNSNGELVASNSYYYSLENNSNYSSSDPNRVESWTHYDPANPSNVTKSVSYMDGLGRNLQNQVRGGSTTIITDTRYNERGLPEVTSRPYQIANQTTYKQYGFEGDSLGIFVPGSALPSNSSIEDEYQSLPSDDEDYAYSQIQYEASPLARTQKSTLPGPSHKMGSDKEMEMSYGLNTTESFTINGKTWAANTLSKTVSRDPEGNETITYTDGWGQTIVSGTNMNPASDDVLNKSSSDLVTYFEYDLKGNLVRVEDPRGLATTYSYNQKGELTSKKLPDQEYSVDYKYDEKGRLRFTQDPNQKSSEQDITQSLSGGTSITKTIVANSNGVLSFNLSWFDLYMGNYSITIKRTDDNSTIYSTTFSSEYGSISTQTFNVGSGTYEFKGEAEDPGDIITTSGAFEFESNDIYTYTKYDELDRPIETGEYAGSTSFSSADPDTDTFPTSGNEANIQYYYDGDQAYSGSLTPQNMQGRISKVSYRDLSVSTTTWGHTYYSYNSLGLVEWVVQDLPGLSVKKIDYDYDELGRLTQMDYQAGVSGEEFYQRYTYDALGRMEKVETSTDGSTWIKDAEYTSFFADGQPTQLKLGNSNIQTVDYLYTVQGWLDKINDGSISTGTNGDRFGMNLDYDYSGNIDLQQWRQVGTAGTNQNTLSYSYSYDNANRLTAADFSGSGYNSDAFDLEWMNYDKNGNITGYLRRDNNGNIGYDGIGYFGLSYESGTNRLDEIVEQIDYLDFDIDHDASGNMTKNMLQGFTSVDYDWRNLPAQLIKGANTLQYAYDSEGNRVKKKMGSTETHYVRGAGGETIAVYENDVVQFHNMLAGSDVIGTWDGTQRRYFLKDHLGSVRTTVDQSGNVDGYDDYYPFGLTMPTRSNNSANDTDKYKFTGHERDTDADLTLDYMMARNYDPIIGRFLQIDPLADQFPGWTPYHYVYNNPLNLIDPTGMAAEECCLQLFLVGAKAALKNRSVSVDYDIKVSGGFQVAAESRNAGLNAGFNFNLGSITLFESSGTVDLSLDGIEFSNTNNDLKTKGDDVEITQEISGSAPFISGGAEHKFSLKKSGENTTVSNQEVNLSLGVGAEKSTDSINLKTGDRSITNKIEASRNTAFIFGFKRSLSIKTGERKPVEIND